MSGIARRIRAAVGTGTLRRSVAGTAAVKVGAMGVAFLSSLVFARSLGPQGYGLYAYLLSWVAVVTIPASLGIPGYLVREGARSPQQGRALLRWADRRIHLSGALAAMLLAGGWLLPDAADARWLFLLAAPVPWLTNLSGVRQSLLQAHGWIVRSQWPQLLLAPLAIVVAAGALWLGRGSVSVSELMVISGLAALLPLAMNAYQLRALRQPSLGEVRSDRISQALPFMWLNALFLVNSRTDLILLGAIKGTHEAGIYAVAARAAELVSFFLAVVNIAIGPRIAQLHSRGETGQLQALATTSARYVFLVAAVLATVAIAGAGFLLRHFYGEAFAGGTMSLRILALAQLLCALAGPVGVLLNMTEHTAASARAFALSAALNVAMILALVPTFGAVGAATATGLSTVFCCWLRWSMVRRHLGIRPSCLGF
ncbi:flippase [Frateuria sp. GZRe12]|uniref:flippase n=1 Tax=Frateuria sp. GZRe12 TaxID=3351533 RepID=UPI003EDBDD62